MQAVNVNELMLDPLAGCLPVMQMPGNIENMIDSISLRIRVCTPGKTANKLVTSIKKEAKNSLVTYGEYAVNELLFELRQALQAKANETDILNRWAGMLMKKHKTDEVLDFINGLKRARKDRLKD